MHFFVVLICNVLINRGKILEDFVKNSGVSVAELSRRIRYERTTIYRHFAKDDLEFAIILKYGKALKHDFSVEFPEMTNLINEFEPSLSDYKVTTVAEALKERDFWKDKYISLLEKHNQLLTSRLEGKEK